MCYCFTLCLLTDGCTGVALLMGVFSHLPYCRLLVASFVPFLQLLYSPSSVEVPITHLHYNPPERSLRHGLPKKSVSPATLKLIF